MVGVFEKINFIGNMFVSTGCLKLEMVEVTTETGKTISDIYLPLVMG
jgi:hypothetical protein